MWGGGERGSRREEWRERRCAVFTCATHISLDCQSFLQIPADGNCLYSAIADQMNRQTGQKVYISYHFIITHHAYARTIVTAIPTVVLTPTSIFPTAHTLGS